MKTSIDKFCSNDKLYSKNTKILNLRLNKLEFFIKTKTKELLKRLLTRKE